MWLKLYNRESKTTDSIFCTFAGAIFFVQSAFLIVYCTYGNFEWQIGLYIDCGWVKNLIGIV